MVTQLQSGWDDQDLRDRDRGSKGNSKSGRTFHFADADREWYAEQVSHSMSGEGAEVEVSWSYDREEVIWRVRRSGPRDP